MIIFKKGPSIHLHVLTKGPFIIKTELKAANEAAFFCDIQLDNENKSLVNIITQWLHSYVNKETSLFKLPFTSFQATDFEKEVYQKIAQIDFGKTNSYQDIAEMMGSKKKARAVGNACNKNPFPLFVPCHRVINKNNKIGGFAMPIEIKSRLLKFEAS